MKPQLRFLGLIEVGAAAGALTGETLGGAVSKSGASPNFRFVVRGALSMGDRCCPRCWAFDAGGSCDNLGSSINSREQPLVFRWRCYLEFD